MLGGNSSIILRPVVGGGGGGGGGDDCTHMSSFSMAVLLHKKCMSMGSCSKSRRNGACKSLCNACMLMGVRLMMNSIQAGATTHSSKLLSEEAQRSGCLAYKRNRQA